MQRQPVGNHASDLVITSSRKDQAVGPVVLTLIIAATCFSYSSVASALTRDRDIDSRPNNYAHAIMGTVISHSNARTSDAVQSFAVAPIYSTPSQNRSWAEFGTASDGDVDG